MRIEEDSTNLIIIENLKNDNESLTKENKELSKKVLILKDRNSNMSKAVVTLSIILFIALVVLIICGYNYTKDLAEQKLQFDDQKKIADDQKNMLDDNAREIRDKSDELSQLKSQVEEQFEAIKELKEKISDQKETIEEQKKTIDEFTNNQNSNTNQDFYEVR